MLEREILILADRNLHISSSMKISSTGSRIEPLWKKLNQKKKKQMSRIILLLLTTKCARLWRNHPSVPGYVRFFASYFSRGASSISLLYLCQHSGRDAASRVNDEQGDRWFLLSSGVMAPSLVSVIEPRLTDRHTNRMADLYIVARWRWPFTKIFLQWSSRGAFCGLIAIITASIT